MMRKTITAIILIFLLASAVPIQASANWYNPWAPYELSESRTYPSFWYNRVYEQPPAPSTPPAPTVNNNSEHTFRNEEQSKPVETVESIESVESVDYRVEEIIQTGMKYLGTPYEFGSNRSNPNTFDCSDFVRHIFKESAGVKLPADSRKQGKYVQDLGNEKNQISDLKRGDLMFFMKYKGSDPEDYAGINKSDQRITHVGIYLGDGEILHTYSKKSGGVRTNEVMDTGWEYRFLFGGSALE